MLSEFHSNDGLLFTLEFCFLLIFPYDDEKPRLDETLLLDERFPIGRGAC